MNCLTLFAGAGGADIGLSRAGFHHLACMEGDATACATLRAAGFPAVHAWIGGVGPDGQPAFVPPDEPVDLLWASPPCQPYSIAGKRQGAEDARDGWPATLGVIDRVRPRWVIVENVRGAPVEAWSEQLAALGYVTSWALLDAADWGLPSHRRRLFVVAGPVGYRWPTPTHAEGNPLPPLKPWASMGQALHDSPDQFRPYADPTGPRSIKCILSQPAAAVTCQEVKGTRASKANNYRFHGGPDRASDSAFLALNWRRLTVAECAKLVGFPDGYPLQGTSEARYRQIGNAVAPVMAEVLARGLTGDDSGCRL